MASKNIETKVEELIKPIINDLGYELYDVKYEKEAKDYYLRIIIDKENSSIDINDCENVNNAITDILDEKDYIKEQYFLEVSSPGIERVLRKDIHFIKQKGNKIYLKLYSQVNGKKEIEGILEDFLENERQLILNLENTTKVKIDLKNIAIAKTIFDW